jgi:hypothetical protein
MPLSPDKQEELKRATIEYLETLTLIHIWDQPQAHIGIDYQQHCFMNTFISSEKDGPHGLFAPMAAWENYLTKVKQIAESRIQRRFIGRAIDALYQQESTLPTADTDIERFAVQIIEWCDLAYEHSVTAYIPLENIQLNPEIDQIPLADAVLYRGRSDSKFAHHLSNLSDTLDFKVPSDVPFLKITVIGDDESIEDQVAAKTNDALSALRFISWTNTTIRGTQRVSYNQARDVARYPVITPVGHFIIVDSKERVFNRYQTDRTDISVLRVDTRQLEQFREFGLENINHHFANESHPVSAHILLALQWYDSGLLAVRKRDTLYRFVVGVNGILSWGTNAISNSRELCRRYKKLLTATAIIETDSPHLDFFSTLSTEQREFEETVTLEDSIEVMAEEYAKIFKDLYDKQRGFILHGYPSNPSEQFPLTEMNVNEARLLAQNAIRLLMKLIMSHPEWTSRESIENWFASN